MAEAIRVTIYGDSIMRGTVMDEGQRYRATMPAWLAKLGEEFGICFKNRSHFGITIDRGGQLIEKDLEKGMDCDYAVVEFGGNDCSFRWEEVAEAPEKTHLPLTPVERFKARYVELVEKLKSAGVTPVLMTLPPLEARRHLEFVGKTAEKRDNILHWLGDAHMIYRFHELYSLAIGEVAMQTESLLVDVRSRFLTRHDFGDLQGPDGVHPTPAGYAVFYEAFRDCILARRSRPQQRLFA